MFGIRKTKRVRRKSEDGKPFEYRQVAVTPEAHKRLRKLAKKKKTSMVKLVDELVGV